MGSDLQRWADSEVSWEMVYVGVELKKKLMVTYFQGGLFAGSDKGAGMWEQKYEPNVKIQTRVWFSRK